MSSKAKKSLIFFLTFFTFSLSLFAASEKEWQEAWNDAYAHGKLEIYIDFGRIDILTDEYAIEVDHVYKFHEGIGQALHYAYDTGNKPGLALFIDGKRDTKEKFNYAKKLANSLGIKVWLMNDIVDPNKTKSKQESIPEAKRKQIWQELIEAERLATRIADRTYPLPDVLKHGYSQFETKRQIRKRNELWDKLREKHEKEIAKQYNLTHKQLEKITMEGLTKKWAVP